MGHYDDCDDPPTPLELKQHKASLLIRELRKLPSSKFTVDELGFLLKVGWPQFQTYFYDSQCDSVFELAKREGVD